MTTVDWLDQEPAGRGGLRPGRKKGSRTAGVKGCKRSRHGLGLIECKCWAALSGTAHCTAAAPSHRRRFRWTRPPVTLRIYGRFTDFYGLICDQLGRSCIFGSRRLSAGCFAKKAPFERKILFWLKIYDPIQRVTAKRTA